MYTHLTKSNVFHLHKGARLIHCTAKEEIAGAIRSL
jgi:hypothetical protein